MVDVFVTNSDDLSNVATELLEKYLDWLETFFIKSKDGKLYWTDEAAAEDHAKVKKYLDNKKIRDEGLALRREFAKEFNKFANKLKIKKGDNE